MFFEKIYKPIPLAYNLVLAMMWRHPQNVDLDTVKVVHYCAAVSFLFTPNFCNFYMKDKIGVLSIQGYVYSFMDGCTCAGIEAVEVQWEGGKHGEGRYKDVGAEMVGHIQ